MLRVIFSKNSSPPRTAIGSVQEKTMYQLLFYYQNVNVDPLLPSDSGYGWSSPSQGYAPAPSSAYGVPSSSYGAPSPAYGSPGGGGLSRQTSILTAIDNLSNMYGNNNDQTQPQKMLPNNLEENYSQAYQGGQSVQSSAQNNYPYYYYQNQPVQPGGGDGYAEKTNLDNSQLPQPNETPTNVAG